MLTLKIILFVWAFWYVYVLVMGFYRAHLAGTMRWYTYVLASPALIVGYLTDIFAQYTVATIYFRDWPAKGEFLVTDRLQRYLKNPNDYSRYKTAKFICEKFLDIFDPRGKHC